MHLSAPMLVTAATVLFLSSPVLAPPSLTMTQIAPHDDPRADAVVEKSYGGQILLVDGAGIAMMLVGASVESGPLAVAGLLTMGFGPGVVHASHDRGGAAIGSMILRPSAVLAGFFVGAAMEDCSQGGEFCGLGGALIGGLVGYGAAAVFDAAHLAREKRTAPASSWTPRVAASPQGVQVGVGGSF